MQLDPPAGHPDRLPHAARPRRRHVPVGDGARSTTLDAMAVPLAEGARVVRAGQADVLDQARHPAARRPADPPGRRGRAARPARAPQARARRRGPVRRASARGRCRSCRARVGLICGRGSAAEKDVVENARRRWPSVRVRDPPGRRCRAPDAVTEVGAALRELDRDRAVDVIIITRGGGAFEDLLPFSNEALVRAVARRGHPGDQRHRPRRRHPAARLRRRRGAPPRRPTRPSWSCPTSAEQRAAVGADPRPAAPGGRHAGRLRAPAPGRPAQPAGHGRPRRPWSPRAREELDALTRPGAPPGAGQRAPCRRPGRAPARAGAGPVAAVHARARLRRRAARRRPRRHGPEDVGADELLRVRVARGDFGVRPVS